MARGVRKGCPASGFSLAMAFDPSYRWFEDMVIPRNLAAPDFLYLAPCACSGCFVFAVIDDHSFSCIQSGLNENHRRILLGTTH